MPGETSPEQYPCDQEENDRSIPVPHWRCTAVLLFHKHFNPGAHSWIPAFHP
jgi:hypothetical protein